MSSDTKAKTENPALAPAPAARRAGRNIIAVASGKGGVGKTWFSISLASALSQRGQKVMLFDGDLGLANVDIQLGLMVKMDIGSVLTGRVTLAQARVRYEACGFDVVAGRSGSGSLANVPLQRLQVLAEDLALTASGYGRVIIDLGAGVEKAVRELARPAETILVVTSDEPTSLTDAYAFIKVTTAERPGVDLRVVVNSANSTREGERTYATLRKACEGFLKISPPLAGIIRRDMRVREAIRNQTPILVRSPASEAARDVEAIAERLLGS